MRRLGVLFVVAVAATGCGSEGSDVADEPTALEAAYDSCFPEEQDEETYPYIVLEDGGATLLLSSGPASAGLADVACALGELDASSALTAKMDRTSAMMGVQTDSEDGLDYEWTYHPDNGFDVIVTEAD